MDVLRYLSSLASNYILPYPMCLITSVRQEISRLAYLMQMSDVSNAGDAV